MSRSDPAQQDPEPHRDYSSFPAARLRPGQHRWRAHQARYSPWFYSSGPSARFNLDKPDGTMYVASRMEVAVREAAGALMVGICVIDSDWADRRTVSKVPCPGRRLANLRSSRAPDFGIVPGEITGPFEGYRIPRAWALCFHRWGFEGVRYSSRFSSPHARLCEALFGPTGPADGEVLEAVPMRHAVAALSGYRVAERPSSVDITINAAESSVR